jgi:uncharacterized protein involved in exopolysaccharide biosynthesis
MENPFSLHFLWPILARWKRPLIAFVLLATLGGYLATWVLPKKYLSVTTVVPSNPLLSDKAYLFAENLQELNSVYGVEEDLDRLLATAQLDGNLNYLVDSFKLTDHYKISGETENGSVKMQVWDTDKNLAASMANAWAQRTEMINRNNNQQGNNAYLEQLQKNIAGKSEQYKKLSEEINGLPAGAAREIKETEKKALLATLEADMKLNSQLQTTYSASSPGLVVLEKAYPSVTADKPNKWLWIAGAFFASLFLGILLAVLLESFKNKKS